METGGGFSLLDLLYVLIFATVCMAIVWKYKVKRNKKVIRDIDETSKTRPPNEKSNRKSTEPEPIHPIGQNIGESPKIFISYRRDDSINITGRIYDRLTQHFGNQNVFKDVDSIPLGVDFRMHLNEVLAETSVSLVVIGKSWLNNEGAEKQSRLLNPSDFVRIEVETSLKRNIPVIPLFVHEAMMPLEDDLPNSLKSLVYRNGISIRPDPDFHNDINRLMNAIGKYIKSD